MKKNNYWNKETSSLEGTLVTASVVQKQWNGIVVEISAFSGSVNSVTKQYKATYNNGNWILNQLSESIS